MVQVLRGAITLNGELFNESDCAAVSGDRELIFKGADSGGEFLLFDLA